MSRADFSLDQLRIETPCPINLDLMPGNDRTRFCTECNLHVTNVSSMKRADAEAFVASRGDGRTCVQFFRHTNGNVAAADDSLPRRLSTWLSRRAMRTAAAIGIGTLLMNALGCWGAGNIRPTRMMGEIETPAQRDSRRAEEKACAVRTAGMVPIANPPATQPAPESHE